MPRSRHLAVWVAAAFALAVALRWFVTLRYYRDLPLGLSDNFFYHKTANLLAGGRGFVNPFTFGATGAEMPSAAHPPLYSLYLAGWSMLGADTALWHRLASGLVSASAVVPAALVVHRLAGSRTAALAAFGVAAYPPLWMNDGLILSESLYIPIAAASLLAAQRAAENPTPRRIVALSAVLAAGALTRSETVLLFPLLMVPLVLTRRGISLSAKFGRLLAGATVAALIMAPWVGRNLAVFNETTLLSTGAGFVMEMGNCDLTYSGTFIGYWHKDCDQTTWPDGDESVIGASKMAAAREYVAGHLAETPKVAAARVGRLFGLFRPFQTADFDALFERRIPSHVQLGLWAHWAASVLAVVGAVTLRRRAVQLLAPLAMIATAVIAAAVSFGVTRYRVGADVSVIVLAAVAAGALADRWLPRRAGHNAASRVARTAVDTAPELARRGLARQSPRASLSQPG